MMSEKVVRRSLVDQVHLFLVQRIQNRSLQPGERLNIEELAREFDVSRTPVREAISRLMQEGLVVQNHNAGPCVASFTKEQELDVILANMELFRCVFAFLPETEDPDGLIRELEDHIQDQRQAFAQDDSDAFHASSVRFHTALIERCCNQTICQFAMQTQRQMNMFALYFQVEDNYREKSIEDHQEILDRIRRGAWEEAAALMKQHNAFALEYFAHI